MGTKIFFIIALIIIAILFIYHKLKNRNQRLSESINSPRITNVDDNNYKSISLEEKLKLELFLKDYIKNNYNLSGNSIYFTLIKSEDYKTGEDDVLNKSNNHKLIILEKEPVPGDGLCWAQP
jgi:hypothetical protein